MRKHPHQSFDLVLLLLKSLMTMRRPFKKLAKKKKVTHSDPAQPHSHDNMFSIASNTTTFNQ